MLAGYFVDITNVDIYGRNWHPLWQGAGSEAYMDIILIKLFKARYYQHWELEKLSSSINSS